MAHHARRPRPETVLRSGELLVSHNHIAILHGLYDRPEGMARSTADLVRAAKPDLDLFGSTIGAWNTSVRAWQMHPSWVSTEKLGLHRLWRLEERGHAILKREVPARIRGHGPYRGLAEIREASMITKSAARIDARWEKAFQDPAFQPLAQSVIEAVRVWNIRNAPAPSMMAAMRHKYYRNRVWLWLRNYALRHLEMPSGTHNLSPAHRVPEMVIDFDALMKPRRE